MTNFRKLSGTELGVYQLEELLFDEADLVATYKAYQPSLKRHVAIQVMNSESYDDYLIRDGFIKASELIADLEHANIAPVHDFGIQDKIVYIVTRLMDGGALRQRLTEQSLRMPDIITMVKQIGSALDYVHSREYVHGDPSVANIMFDKWGNAYIGDFHVAGFQAAGFPLIGTPLFMAPELTQGGRPTPMTDQYALAKIAFEVIVAQFAERPFMYSPNDIFDGALAEHFPAELLPIFKRALALTPENRFPTLSDFARALEQALNTTPRHVFISYSRRDLDYAKQLSDALKNNGFDVWIDSAIEHGDQWFNEIHQGIKASSAVAVIMTPDSERSEWVHKEILLAKRYKKPIFPVLLSGDEFPILIDIQFADVRDNSLPDMDFYRRLGRTIFGRA